MNSLVKGKTVLVTGGTGSIGCEVVRQCLEGRAKVVRIFSRDEYKQFMLRNELGERPDLRYLLGDVRSRDRLLRAMEGVDFVFHCAAYKHVPLCEYNPFEAVQTNVVGTENVIAACLANNVERLINISTDKAANPMNVLGATKLLSERLTSSAMHSVGPRKTRMCSVRFGNVFGSRGSVVPLFIDQIRRGGPLTITNPDMTRFFLSIRQAVRLVFSATEAMGGGEVFILQMPVVRLGDIADVLIEELAPRFGHDPRKVKRNIIGIRPGERMYEVLMTDEESEFAYQYKSMFVVAAKVELPQVERKIAAPWEKHAVKAKHESYASDRLPVLQKEDILRFLKDEAII